jgi:hypothetical protein
MMRLQFESISEKVYKIIDEELEMETDEARETYKEVVQALFKCFAKKYDLPQVKAIDSASKP